MSLTDLVSGLDIAVLPQAALVLFVAAFAAILISLFRKGSTQAHHDAARIPLEDTSIARQST